MNTDGKFPNGLNALMGKLGPTKLAQILSTKKQNVDRWRKGAQKIPIAYARQIANHFGVDLEQVLTPPEQWSDEEFKAVAQIDGRRVTRNLSPGAVPEIDSFLGGGGGGYPLPAEITENGRSYSAEAVQDEWIFPQRFIRDELRLQISFADIVPIRGNSMEDGAYGGFREGDRVLVDRRDHNIRQGGIFAIRDDGETIIKQVELVRGSDPVRITCKSLNSRYSPFELILDGSAEIIGRVVLKISRT